MATYKLVGYVRDPTSAAGESGATVTIKKHVDGTTVTTDATDSAGRFEIANDTLMYPGPVYSEVTVGATTKKQSGNVSGQIGGFLWLADLIDLFKSFPAGVLKNVGFELAVSADGADMQVDTAAGAALLKDGGLYVQEGVTATTISAADGTNPRIDRIVLRLTREGETEQGKVVLAALAGTPAASPVAPTLTQSSALWEVALAQVLVGAGVTTIAANKVTDERTFAFYGTSAGTFAEGNHAHSGTYQPLDAQLTDIAGLTPANDTFLVGNGTNFVAESGATVRGSLGLSNVENTSDASKPVSTATQTALDLKANLASPTFTGTVTAAGLTTTGAVALGDADSDTLKMRGRRIRKGVRPSIAVQAAAGSGAAASIVGTDEAGIVTIDMGSGDTTGDLAIITLTTARASGNWYVRLEPMDADSVANQTRIRALLKTTTTWAVNVPSTALSDADEHQWGYEIVEWEEV